MAKNFHFEDVYEIRTKNADGNHFDNVTRIDCIGEAYELQLTLDYNSRIYELNTQDKFTMALVNSLDGESDSGSYVHKRDKVSILDKYEYAMAGTVFRKFEKDSKTNLIASFGGLLMKLRGDTKILADIDLDARIYLLIRKLK